MSTVATVAGRRSGALAWVGTASRMLLAGVWLYAGASKIGDLDASVRAVKAYQILPAPVAEVVGAALPPVEIALGVLLLVGLATRFAALASAALLAAFIAGVASAWARGLRIDCGCFGGGGELPPGESPAYLAEIVRDVLFLAAAVYLIARPASRLSLDGRLHPPEPPTARN
jgi:uncharacterized membrane protein YphA (DoxX/SURF4 family)